MNEVVSKLSDEHLQEWRQVCATRDAVVNNPRAFTAEESIQAYMDYFAVGGRFFEIYDIDASEEWRVSPWSGHIYYEVD
jgi:hypothetical protein